MWHSYFRLAQIIPKKTFFFSIITQNGPCALIFLKRTSPRPSGTNLKGCKGFVACEYSRPSSLPRAIVVFTQTCHRGGSDTEDDGRIIRVSPVPARLVPNRFSVSARWLMEGTEWERSAPREEVTHPTSSPYWKKRRPWGLVCLIPKQLCVHQIFFPYIALQE